MSKEGSVAPKERINIKYVPATGDAQAEVELPLKTLVVGDFKGHTEETPLEERKSISIDKNNFESVMRESNLRVKTAVSNKLEEEEGSELAVDLQFNGIADFSPDAIASQVPELKKLIELREALVALKGPLGNIAEFRKSLQGLITSDESREQLLAELSLINENDSDQAAQPSE